LRMSVWTWMDVIASRSAASGAVEFASMMHMSKWWEKRGGSRSLSRVSSI
jgi:hypothetical protein